MIDLKKVGYPLRNSHDLDLLLERVGDARFVLLGEASHGTSEYYTWRTEISKRLIKEKNFSFIAVEGDWPDCYKINAYIQGKSSTTSPRDILEVFKRWPTWMWANEEVSELVTWLRVYNEEQEHTDKIGFYGLDIYSLWDSLAEVIRYLEKYEPDAVQFARETHRCFLPDSSNSQKYAHTAAIVPENCKDAVIKILSHFSEKRVGIESKKTEEFFDAEQNALIIKNAEHYYRVLLHGSAPSWNVRDKHMVETLNRLMEHYGKDAKAIVWAHNTHIGDARATDMYAAGMVNVGQLVREQQANARVFVVGFGSYKGTVVASNAWDVPCEAMPLPPAKSGSWEELMHQTFNENQLLLLTETEPNSLLYDIHGNRALGVVYNPEVEAGNYVSTSLAARYDAFLYFDTTKALIPHVIQAVHDYDLPETYPTGL